MTKLKWLSNKTFYDSFGYCILGKTTFMKSSFSALKLDIFTFYACNKMYIQVAAVSNDIKVEYFSKTDFEGNVFNENCAHLLSIYPLQSQK